MFEYSCICGANKIKFKFDIGGPFTGDCCALASLTDTLEDETPQNPDEGDDIETPQNPDEE